MAIGLPTCKKIVGRHGGGIRGAQEGRGTMFFFNLPVCTEGLPAQASCGKSDQLA
jgi:signal transduction histidine kinase